MNRLCLLLAAFATASPAAASGAVQMDRETAGLIDEVNRGVNRGYRGLAPYDDPNGDGVWDCENYAAEKMRRLAAAGVSRSAMMLWRVRTPRDQWHAVLVVSVVRDGRPVQLVLDNLTPWATPRERRVYTDWAPMSATAWQGAATASAAGR